MTRMNWTAANDRARIQRHGAESVAGKASGARPMPVDQPSPRPGRKGPMLAEPVTVARFWKNRSHDAIVVELSTFEGRNLVDVRTNVMSRGRLVPTTKGISVAVLRLPDLAKAINNALAKAKELGLIPADGAGE
jgi:Transcriptional Coactivator p15 (PC4)